LRTHACARERIRIRDERLKRLEDLREKAKDASRQLVREFHKKLRRAGLSQGDDSDGASHASGFDDDDDDDDESTEAPILKENFATKEEYLMAVGARRHMHKQLVDAMEERDQVAESSGFHRVIGNLYGAR
jgi:hypothetical protein